MKRRTFHWSSAATVLALSVGTFVAGTGIASANTGPWDIVKGCCYVSGEVGTNNSDRSVYVCDLQSDNVGVFVEYYSSTGDHDFVGDSNGAQPGCGTAWATGGGRITKYRGYSYDGATSPWIYV